jgi:hypothetical protein
MYGHEVFDVLTKASKVIRDTLFPSHVSDIGLYRMTVYFMQKRRHHYQATSFSSDLDDVNFPVTVANCVSPFWVSPEQYRGD